MVLENGRDAVTPNTLKEFLYLLLIILWVSHLIVFTVMFLFEAFHSLSV